MKLWRIALLSFLTSLAWAQKINLGPPPVNGTLQASNCPALTGDVTASANTCATTLTVHTLTINTSSPLAGGGSVALGGTLTITCTTCSTTTGTVTSIATTAPITGGTITSTGTIACATCAIGPGSSSAGHLATFTNTNGVNLQDGGVVPTGTVTSIATTSPIGGGTITSTGTLTCTTCVVASSPGVGIAHFGGGTQTVTSSAVNLASADVTGVLPPANGGSASTMLIVAGYGGTSTTAAVAVIGVSGWFSAVPVTTSTVEFTVVTADATHNADVGLYTGTSGGTCTRLANVGPATYASTGAKTAAWAQGTVTLPAGRFYIATTVATGGGLTLRATQNSNTFFSYATTGSTTLGTLPTSFTCPADSWLGTGTVIQLGIF